MLSNIYLIDLYIHKFYIVFHYISMIIAYSIVEKGKGLALKPCSRLI